MVSYPYSAEVILGDPEHQLLLIEGRNAVQSGGVFPATVLLQPGWAAFIEHCHLQWLVDFIQEKTSNNIAVTGEMILEEYEKIGSS
jgi:hypothetical protein